MEYYMDDEKWKLSREDKQHTYSAKPSSSSSSSSISRSVSQRASSKSHKNHPFNLSRSTSQKSSSNKSSSSSSLSRSSSQRCAEFTRKCSSLAKEQKAKFYIVKRCITMLVSWKKNGDS